MAALAGGVSGPRTHLSPRSKGRRNGFTLGTMTGPGDNLPIDPESDAGALRAAEDAEDAAEADAAMDEPGDSIPLEQLEAEFDV